MPLSRFGGGVRIAFCHPVIRWSGSGPISPVVVNAKAPFVYLGAFA
jgi:hypothetical protein